ILPHASRAPENRRSSVRPQRSGCECPHQLPLTKINHSVPYYRNGSVPHATDSGSIMLMRHVRFKGSLRIHAALELASGRLECLGNTTGALAKTQCSLPLLSPK